MPQLRIHGPPGLRLDNGADLALSAREAALLAWLHEQGPTPRARLAGLLWPAGTEAQARANLRQTLARLRRAAGPVVVDQDAWLSLPADLQLESDAGRALLAGLEFDDAPEFAQWLAARRDDAARARQRGLLLQGRDRLAQGQLDPALDCADALLAEQPESEEAWRLRMEVLYRRGDRAAAIAAWDDCRDALRRAFGVAPSAATRALGQLILDSDAPGPETAPGTLPLALRRPPQLVGRGSLLAAIARAFALGRSVLVLGPGGMGKSRVLQQAAAGLQPALMLSARPGDAALPGELAGRLMDAALQRFAPVLDPATQRDAARLLPGAATDALSSERAHRRVLAAALRSLDACHAAGMRLLVLDDLQFADEASLALLQQLAAHWLARAGDDDASAPRLLLGARGDELGPAGQALVQDVMRHAHGACFELPPLSPDDVRDLLHQLLPAGGPDPAALAAALHARVGGNPAHVLEALKSLWLDGMAAWQPDQPLPVPATLLESLRARLQRLPPEALQLAQLAAVAQSDFDAALASAAFGRPPLALAPLFSALESAQVFQGSQFSHDLVAEAVQRSLPQALAAPLHRLVAEHLAQRGGDAARVARHLVAAGEARAAAPWQLQAAQAARQRWQLAEAAAGFAAAARGYGDAGAPGAAFAAWCDALRCWIALQRLDETQQALQAAAALARTRTEQARLLARRVHHLAQARRLGEATLAATQLAQVLEEGTEALDADEAVYALRAACLAVQNGLLAARVLALAGRLRPAVEQAGAEVRAAFALAQSGPLLWEGQPRAAAAELEAAMLLLDAQADPELRQALINQLMRVRQALGDLPGALTLGQALLAQLRQAGDAPLFEADVLNILALVQVAHGEAAAAFASLAELQACLRRAGQPVREIHAVGIALCCLACGRLDEARAWLDRHTQPPGRPGHALIDHVLLLARARLAAACGEPTQPWTDGLAALTALPAGALLHRRVLLATLQPPPLPQVLELLAEVRARGQDGLARSVEIAAARAALAAGLPQVALAHARSALERARCVDAWGDHPASVWAVAGDALAACGHHEEAQAVRAAGARWVEQGARQWPDEAQRLAWCEGNATHRALLRHGAG